MGVQKKGSGSTEIALVLVIEVLMKEANAISIVNQFWTGLDGPASV